MIDCNEWKTEKGHECANMGKVRETTRIMMATVSHFTSGSGLRKFQADGFLFDRVYMILQMKVGAYGGRATNKAFCVNLK